MRSPMKVLFFLVMAQAVALAQASSDRRVWGYGFIGVGGTSRGSVATGQAGGGGEGLVYKGLGFGAEVGYLGPIPQLNEGFGILSTNASYHFVKAGSNQKLVPFVTGGYSLAFRSGSFNGGNFGGGVQYWVRPRVGLRFEFRDHVFSSVFSSDSPHLYCFRVGISFR